MYLHVIKTIPTWEIERIGPKVPGHEIPTFIELKKGARIDFLSAQGGADARRRFQAAEIDLLVCDEEISSDYWIELQARLISRGGKIIISATRVESEEWINDLEDRALNGDKDIAVFYFFTEHNKYNNTAAVQRFAGNLSEEEKEVRLFGKRRRSSGLVYSSFSEENLIDPFEIPKDWTKVMCTDPGFRVTAALYVAISPNYKRYAYRELYIRQGSAAEFVNNLRIGEGWDYQPDSGLYFPGNFAEHITFRLIDPAAFSHQGDGTLGIGMTFANEYGLHFTPANNDKLSNIEAVRRWLLKDKDGKPNFYVFRNLTNFQAEIKKYRLKGDRSKRDSDSAPDRPLKKDDHLMNCLEYIAEQGINFIPGQTPEQMLRQRVLNNDAPLDHQDRIKMIKMRNAIELERTRRRSNW